MSVLHYFWLDLGLPHDLVSNLYSQMSNETKAHIAAMHLRSEYAQLARDVYVIPMRVVERAITCPGYVLFLKTPWSQYSIYESLSVASVGFGLTYDGNNAVYLIDSFGGLTSNYWHQKIRHCLKMISIIYKIRRQLETRCSWINRSVFFNTIFKRGFECKVISNHVSIHGRLNPDIEDDRPWAQTPSYLVPREVVTFFEHDDRLNEWMFKKGNMCGNIVTDDEGIEEEKAIEWIVSIIEERLGRTIARQSSRVDHVKHAESKALVKSLKRREKQRTRDSSPTRAPSSKIN